ncbi:DUF2141 domain-containing protein [Piscinibacter terrae]|uniref:DUF2141 domain-containing protein n=1 Tax=Piscinibacter terrae TaxID=2496871 RepID=A0A3N7HU87_9BURK|nr:DUF2141 domain-containing protein [Albitalea terrae]RQP25824.1 DUF2141 domain-containing protein [Albitalea terrae]
MNRAVTQVLATTAVFFGMSAAAQALELRVEVVNAKSDKGTILGAVYGTPAAWLKDGQQVQGAMDTAKEKAVLVYRNLPAGSYAISVFHDENGNGKLDTNVVGFPTERYGFSRDAKGNMAPPSFSDAVVDLQADTTITVTLR